MDRGRSPGRTNLAGIHGGVRGWRIIREIIAALVGGPLRASPIVAVPRRPRYARGRPMQHELLQWCIDNLPDFEIRRELGRGAMGVAFLATQKSLNRQVAIKLLSSGRQFRDDLSRFHREAKAYATLSHPHLIRIYDADLASEIPYIVMEYLEGCDLRSSLGTSQRLDTATSGRALASALAYIHERGIVHRDIKSANVFLKTDRTLVLMDFGLAKPVDPNATAVTEAGMIVGTPQFMAPEILGGEDHSKATDVYSLGLTLYEMAADRAVFKRSGDGIDIPQRVRGLVPSLRRLGVPVAPTLDELVMACLAAAPESRPTAAEMVQRLDEISNPSESLERPTRTTRIGDATTSDRRIDMRVALARASRRKMALAAGCLVTAALAIFGWRMAADPSASATPTITRTPRPVATTRQVVLPKELTGDDGAPMVLVAGGAFTLGPWDDVTEARKKRRSSLPDFYIDRCEVTNRLYDRFCKETNHRERIHFTDRSPTFDLPDHPVVGVAFADAAAYARWAKKRLPSEDEWEKAARGVQGTLYPWGDRFPGQSPPLNFRDLSNVRAEKGAGKALIGAEFNELRSDDGYPFTSPVGAFPAGAAACGAMDMAGNVWEWCRNLHDGGQSCIARGGSWRNQLTRVGGTTRERAQPDVRTNAIGFRCARSAP